MPDRGTSTRLPVPAVTVIIPTAGDDPHRTRSRALIESLYAEFFPSWNVQVCADTQEPFSRARVINRAAAATDAEVLVFNDADSLVQPHQLSRAVMHAEDAPGLVFAYTRYRKMTREATEQVGGWGQAFRLPDECFEWEQVNAGSNGVAAIRRADLLTVGGLDEKFQGWGYEDLAFDVICEAHWPSRRVGGDLIHLWHPSAEDRHPELSAANERRYLREYVPRFGDREALLELMQP